MLALIDQIFHLVLGPFYLMLCFVFGWAICSFAFPNLNKVTETAYNKEKITVSSYIILFPVWFLSGTLVLTWITYLVALAFSEMQAPLVVANSVSMSIAILISIFVLYRKVYYKNGRIMERDQPILRFAGNKRIRKCEVVLFVAITLLTCVLMWVTFYVSGDKLNIGISVFSDFSPHIGMIRSFSFGNNFPTTYSHFAGEDIKYHFMFQFLVGNLEFLGMRIDYAFNIPSILSLISVFLLLYLLAVKITGKIGAGMLACFFFAFRSSKSLFTYLSNIPKGTNIIKALSENTDFIGDTTNENWGLWNLNVYSNQRHLAFGLGVILFVIILFLPHLYAMFDSIKKNSVTLNEKNNQNLFKLLFFTKEVWVVKDLRLSIATGILLGSLSFFHGAAVIGCLLVLFVIAILSHRRLELVIVAIITITMAKFQTLLFIQGTAISTKVLFGFIAENKTLFGVASYLERLLGVLPFVLLMALCMEKGVGRYLMFAFTAPMVFAFMISLTVDVTVNHKYIMMSSILLGIFAASLIIKLLERRDSVIRLVGVLLIVMLTATGIYDFTTVIKRNTQISPIVLNLDDSLTNWVSQNSDSKDIFLTSNYSINQIVLGGAMLYNGWQYYAWSAGYDTVYRDAMVKQMYEAQTPSQLEALVKENNIRFIVVDHDTRENEAYIVNEDNIQATYERLHKEGIDEWETSIYDTSLPIY